MAKTSLEWHAVEGHPHIRFRRVDWTTDLDRVCGLFRQYRDWISDHAEEGESAKPRVVAGIAVLNGLVEGLPGAYGPPRGDVLLWFENQDLVACGALRELEPGVGELKRIFIRAADRGEEFGKPFVRTLIARAGELGYRELRSYALGSMAAALEFYEELGFHRIPPYWPHPAAGTVFFQRETES